MTVSASRKADRKAPAKQNINDKAVFDFTPKAIARDLDLLRPIYRSTATGGHFGRTPNVDGAFPWEELDEARIEALLN